MDKLRFVLALFLLLGATEINGESDMKFPPDLIPMTPPNVTFEPIFEKQVVPPQQINERLLTPAEGCGYSPIGIPRIVGGRPARNGGYPWMAILAYKYPMIPGASSFNCGGSLITSRHILTAAHCIKDTLWYARLGEHDYRTWNDGPHQDIEVAEKHVHPQYDRGLLINDVAVLRLDKNVVFNNRIRPICLPIDDELRSRSFEQSNPFVAGWGVIKAGGAASPFLKHVQVPLVEGALCKRLILNQNVLRSEDQIDHKVICAGNIEGQTSCHGDSGGPLMMPVPDGNGKFPMQQIGVVSWGLPCGYANTPTIYSSVQHFGDWIKSIVELPLEVPTTPTPTPTPPPSATPSTKTGLFSQIKKLFS